MRSFIKRHRSVCWRPVAMAALSTLAFGMGCGKDDAPAWKLPAFNLALQSVQLRPSPNGEEGQLATRPQEQAGSLGEVRHAMPRSKAAQENGDRRVGIQPKLHLTPLPLVLISPQRWVETLYVRAPRKLANLMPGDLRGHGAG